jgi:hypothetical protein
MCTGNISLAEEDGHDLAIQDELCDITNKYKLDLKRVTGESNSNLARRIVEALVEKFIDIDVTIHRIKTMVPDVAMEA